MIILPKQRGSKVESPEYSRFPSVHLTVVPPIRRLGDPAVDDWSQARFDKKLPCLRVEPLNKLILFTFGSVQSEENESTVTQ